MKGNAHKTGNGWMVSYLSGIKDLDSISVIPLHPQSSGEGLVDGQEIDFQLEIGAKFDSSDTSTFRYAKIIPKLIQAPNRIATTMLCTDEYTDSFGQSCHTFKVYSDGKLVYERDYGYNVQTELDYITNYLSQTKI